MCESNNMVHNNKTFSFGLLSMKSPFMTLKGIVYLRDNTNA